METMIEEKVVRLHYSRHPLVLPIDRLTHYGTSRRDFFKPIGFWYSAGDAWLEWCKSEMPDWVGTHVYEVDVSAANVLALTTPMAVKRFHEEYRVTTSPTGRFYNIDWGRVAEKYDGVEIIPYHHSIRLDIELLWYYGWDVASGCVWNVDKIVVKPV